MAFAQGQFTIVDYNDAITLSGYLSSNVPKTQRYMSDSGTFLPSWTSSNPVVITPYLYKAGSGGATELITNETNKIKSITWYADNVQIAAAGGNYGFETKSGGLDGNTLNWKLKILNNILTVEDTGLEIRCEIAYYDSASTLTTNQSLTISYSLVRDGGGIVAIEVTTPEGEVFKNGDVKALPVVSKLYRGVVEDTTNVSRQWAYNDSSVLSTSTGGIYHEKFGEGWHVIQDGENGFTKNGNTLTVSSSVVPSMLTIKCAVIDDEPTTPVWYIDGVTLVDRSDPIEVIISSSGGNIFKNGVGSDIVLTARVFQGGDEINKTNANVCSYKWTKYNANGSQETISSNTGKTFTVQPKDVEGKATYWCEVTYPKSAN